MKKNKGAQRKSRQKHVTRGRRTAMRLPALKMKLKKGDTVVAVSGKDKGKQGVILSVMPRENRVIVEGLGMVTRHLRKTGKNQSGRIIKRESALHASNVMLVDPTSKKPTRVGRERADGNMVRIAKKSKVVIK